MLPNGASSKQNSTVIIIMPRQHRQNSKTATRGYAQPSKGDDWSTGFVSCEQRMLRCLNKIMPLQQSRDKFCHCSWNIVVDEDKKSSSSLHNAENLHINPLFHPFKLTRTNKRVSGRLTLLVACNAAAKNLLDDPASILSPLTILVVALLCKHLLKQTLCTQSQSTVNLIWQLWNTIQVRQTFWKSIKRLWFRE